MYNRYIPEDVSYTPVEEHSPPPEPFQGPERGPQQTRLRFPEFLTGKEGLSRLLNSREGGGLSGPRERRTPQRTMVPFRGKARPETGRDGKKAEINQLFIFSVLIYSIFRLFQIY